MTIIMGKANFGHTNSVGIFRIIKFSRRWDFRIAQQAIMLGFRKSERSAGVGNLQEYQSIKIWDSEILEK